jgi:site-specific DNA-cytosine methylase
MQRCTDLEREDLAAYLRWEKGEEIRVSTACSGTDVPLLVYAGLAEAARDILSVPLRIVHRFSCEKDTAKQRFLMQMYPMMPLLFSDASALGAESGHDELSQVKQAIPKDVNSFLVGWPCTDVSNMNKYARTQTNRCCVASGGLRTGGVFKSVIDFCCNHGSELDFLGNENVPALATPPPEGGPDNLTAAVWLLDTQADMYTKTWKLNPMMFGVPQSRDRLWFPSFRRKVLRDLELSDQEADSILTSIMQRIVGSQLADIGLYLFPPEHDILQQVLKTMPTADHTGSNEVQRKWPQQHLKCFEAKGLKWWDTLYPSEEACESYPFLRCMTLREFDLLQLSGVAGFPSRERQFVEVGQSLARHAPPLQGYVRAITPRIKYYITDLCRVLIGIEGLRLQSIHFPNMQALPGFSNELIRDLSGNAFEGSCCAAVIFCSHVLLSKGAAARERASNVQSKAASPAEVDADPAMPWQQEAEVDDDIERIWGLYKNG